MKLLKLLLKTLLLVSITALCARTGNAQAQCGLPGIIFIQYSNNRATCPAGGPNATYVVLGESNVRQATFQCTADTNVQPPPNAGTVYFSYSEPNPLYAFGDLYCNYHSAYSTYECPPRSEVFFTEATSPSDYNRFYNREYSFAASGGACPQSNFVQDFQQCNGLACQPPPPPAPCPGSCSPALDSNQTATPTDYCTYPATGCADGYYDSGGCCAANLSPILIDTTGQGFYLTSAQGGALFDFMGNGHPVQMAWTAPGTNNAFLALPGADGLVHSGKQLFGNLTSQPVSKNPNGFAALAVYDLPANGGNGNGLIDAGDAIFSSLRLWIDANHDGISQPEELHTLPSLGVTSISLNYKVDRRTDQYGNVFRYRAQVDPGDTTNTGRMAYDVFFVTSSPTSKNIPRSLIPIPRSLTPADTHKCTVPVPTKGGMLSTSSK